MKFRDLTAGITLSGLMLPEAIAYAGIAGLPPQRAIVAAMAGCIAYCVLGKSRFAIVTPTSSSAAILAATLAAVPGNTAQKGALVTILVALVALLFLVASAIRLGNVASLISRPVLRGFAFGLAVTIILKQIPVIAGISLPSRSLLHFIPALLASIPTWHVASFMVGIAALSAMLGLRRVPLLPTAILVLAAGVVASRTLHLEDHGVALVGTFEMKLAWPDLSLVQWRDALDLLPYILPLVLILYAESWGTIRSLSLQHGEQPSPNREMAALGVSNLASAFVQGMPVGAGFSAGAASDAAGAQSRVTAVVAASSLAMLAWFADGMIASLPQPVLAAVVIAALTHALDPAPLLRLWRLKRDAFVALAAAFGVISLGVLDGIILAVALSLIALLQRLASPRFLKLGRLGETHDFVDMAKHADALPIPGIGIWRPAQPLFFGNADAMLAAISREASKDDAVRAVILSLEESYDIDSTALEVLLEFDTAVRKTGRSVRYARVHDRVRDLVAKVSPDLPGRCHFSVDDAVRSTAPVGTQGSAP